MKMLTDLAERLYNTEPEHRISILVIPDGAERDVLRQLAAMPRWDGNISSKVARGSLCDKGLVARWNGFNFLTKDGYALVDTIWGLEKFIKT